MSQILSNQQRQRKRHKELDDLQQQMQEELQQQPVQPLFPAVQRQTRQYRKRGPVECPVCKVIHPSQKAVILHLTKDHPDYKFPCGICSRSFNCFNSRYKHLKEHDSPQLFCPDPGCNKAFHFQSEYDRHVGVHNTVLPFPCDSCPKRFASNKSLVRHTEIHLNHTHECLDRYCEKMYPMKDRLYTHFRGAHGKGYDAPCGKHFSWLGPRARHQEDCTPCGLKLQREISGLFLIT